MTWTRLKLLTWSKFDSEPNTHGHNAVVDHVQLGNVLIFLAKNEEELQHRTDVHLVPRTALPMLHLL